MKKLKEIIDAEFNQYYDYITNTKLKDIDEGRINLELSLLIDEIDKNILSIELMRENINESDYLELNNYLENKAINFLNLNR